MNPRLLPLFFAAATSHAAEYYDLKILGRGEPAAINNSGDVVGSMVTHNPYHQFAFLFRNNAIIEVTGAFDRCEGNCRATAINDLGVVCFEGDGHFRWENGVRSQLPLLGFGINNAGLIAGSFTVNLRLYPAYFDGAFNVIGSDAAGGVAWSIIENGEYLLKDGVNSFVCQGTSRRLQLWPPSEPTTFRLAVPTAMNNLGHIVGTGADANGVRVAVRMSETISPLPMPGGFIETFASDINDNGVIVGHGTPAGANARAFRILNETTAVDLNNFIPSRSNIILERATAINNAGQIVGEATIEGETQFIYVLTPSPAPRLYYTHDGPNLTVSWVSDDPAIVLYSASDLLQQNWQPITATDQGARNEHVYRFAISGPRRFLRLGPRPL